MIVTPGTHATLRIGKAFWHHAAKAFAQHDITFWADPTDRSLMYVAGEDYHDTTDILWRNLFVYDVIEEPEITPSANGMFELVEDLSGASRIVFDHPPVMDKYTRAEIVITNMLGKLNRAGDALVRVAEQLNDRVHDLTVEAHHRTHMAASEAREGIVRAQAARIQQADGKRVATLVHNELLPS